MKAILRPDQTLLTLVHLRRILRKIRGMELESGLKRRIRKTYLGTFLLKRYDSKKKVAKIAGYNVRFCSYASLTSLFNEIFLDQEYFFLTNNSRPFIIDCGSNIGMSVLYFKMICPDSEVLAFEPDETAFACLEANINENEIRGVSLKKKAVSNTEGSINFYYDQDSPASHRMSTVKERMPKNRRVVESVPLSRYIDREVDFLKMDVEGAEGGIIQELSNEGKLSRIKQMVIEYHHHIVNDSDVLSRTLRLLEDAGFGYQIEGRLDRPFDPRHYQDILIYAYRKNPPA